MKTFPYYKQLDTMDCGPTCLRMIAKYYGKSFSLDGIRKKAGINREGVSLLGIGEAAEKIGFKTLSIKTTLEKLESEDVTPFIAHWSQNHFVVVYKFKRNKIYIADPGRGLLVYNNQDFKKQWISTQERGEKLGIAMLLEPDANFDDIKDEPGRGLSFKLLIKYLLAYKGLLVQLLLGLFIGSLLQLVFPFLTQSIVDIGIHTHDINFIEMILAAQIMLFLGQTSVDFLRNWVLLHINARLNINILTDFLIKLMKLPIAFFEAKMVGDIIQRMGDQQRIQTFLTGPTLNILFSLFNFVIFTVVIINYQLKIFWIFIIGSIIYVCWVLFFLKYRKKLDYKRFDILAHNQTNIVQLVYGMQEIKMNTCETSKRWQWERIQARVFKIQVKSLELSQVQQMGAIFINQTKNILITFFTATAVVHGQLSLGAMLAVQYIIGQLNGPIEQLIQFAQVWQDAFISMERLNEIHRLEDEEPAGVAKIHELPSSGDIEIKNITFTYPGAGNEPVLKNINLTIQRGKSTAIVGMSGSGKTTLLKLLMKFYVPQGGTITIDRTDLQDIANKTWRRSCGTVMQENYIFPDTIANNIAVIDELPDLIKIERALHIANIKDFVTSLPLGLNTMLGATGNGLSQGQKQRLLIARAVYKNPEFIFFDEATNALDAINESTIMQNLESFFVGKTVIVAAHRLSTVKNADKIVVMGDGVILEQGTHQELLSLEGAYFTLVKNQLNLNNT